MDQTLLDDFDECLGGDTDKIQALNVGISDQAVVREATASVVRIGLIECGYGRIVNLSSVAGKEAILELQPIRHPRWQC